MTSKTHTDFNNDLIVVPWKDGIKLGTFEDVAENFKNSPAESIPTIHNLFKLQTGIFFLNTETIIQAINEYTLKHCGYLSLKDAVGTNIERVAKKETVLFERECDLMVLNSNKTIIVDEYFMRKDELSFHNVAVKTRWYGPDDKIMGVFGVAFITKTVNPFCSESLTLISKTGMLGNTNSIEKVKQKLPGNEFENIYFTKREIDCLRCLIQGKTAKQTAKILNLSYRTIENYLANIKGKMRVSTKSELLQKIMASDHLLL